MEATVDAPSAQTRKDYTSRPGALSWQQGFVSGQDTGRVCKRL